MIYDVTCNKTFTNTSTMIWSRLTRDDTLKANYPGVRTVYRTTEVTRGVDTVPSFLVWINKEPSLQNGFSNWFLNDRPVIPAAEMQTMSTWSSR